MRRDRPRRSRCSSGTVGTRAAVWHPKLDSIQKTSGLDRAVERLVRALGGLTLVGRCSAAVDAAAVPGGQDRDRGARLPGAAQQLSEGLRGLGARRAERPVYDEEGHRADPE
jgi:hypothetical protein